MHPSDTSSNQKTLKRKFNQITGHSQIEQSSLPGSKRWKGANGAVTFKAPMISKETPGLVVSKKRLALQPLDTFNRTKLDKTSDKTLIDLKPKTKNNPEL